jgi:hypothetical protein
MKKITFKIFILFICLSGFKISAQFVGPNTYTIRTVVGDDNGAVGYISLENLDPITAPPGNELVGITQNATVTNNGIFEFVSSGRFFDHDDKSETDEVEVFYIRPAVANKGIIELNNFTTDISRLRLRGNTPTTVSAADPNRTIGDEAGWYVLSFTDENTQPYVRIFTAHKFNTNSIRRWSAATTKDSNGSFVFMNYGGALSTNRDRFILTQQNVLSANSFDSNSLSVSNPVNNLLTIKGLNSKVSEISLYSILGGKVLTKNTISQEVNLDVSALSSGVYILKISSEKGSFSKKIIKE